MKYLSLLGYSSFWVLAACTTSSDLRRAGRPLPKPQVEVVDAQSLKSTSGAQPASERMQSSPQYRQIQDPPEAAALWSSFQTAIGQRDLASAEAILQKYLSVYPQGQYLDQMSFRMGRSLPVEETQKARNYFSLVIDLKPQSPLRSQALFERAKVEKSMGAVDRALESLAQIDIQEMPLQDREALFAFWAELAAQKGRWLESTLAYAKAYWETRVEAPQRKYAEEIRGHIEKRLGEGELNLLLKEYPDRFPQNDVKLRLATLFLARGNKEQVQSFTGQIIASSPTGSILHSRAKQILDRSLRADSVATSKIGILLPQSGPRQALGKSVLEGLRLALEKSSKNKLELVVADVGPNAESARKAFERLVFEDQVMAVVGPLSGEEADKVAELSVEYGVPNINLSARQGILDKGNYVFRTALTPEKQVQALVRYARQNLNAKHFAVLFPEDSFGESYATAYFDAVRSQGGEITAAESYGPKQTDFKVQIENMVSLGFPQFRRKEYSDLLENEKVKLGRDLKPNEKSRIRLSPIVDFDVLFIPDTYKALGQIIPSLLYADVTKPALLGPATWRNPKLLDRAGQYLKEAIIVDAYATDRDHALNKDFVERYQVKYGYVPSSLSALGYDVGLAFVKAYDSSVPGNREDLRMRLESLGRVEGVMGDHQWGAQRDSLVEVQLFRARPGAFSHQGTISIL